MKKKLALLLSLGLCVSTMTVTASAEEEKTYKIGVCQLMEHDALDATYNGFVEGLKEAGYEVAEYRLLPDEQAQIETVLKELSDEKEMDLILTTGGTGFSQRDCTPEATMNVATRNAPGIAEAMRYASLAITPRAMLSRGVSVIRNQTLIINLPGSPKAVKENLEYILPTLSHGLEILKGVTGECGISLKET